MSVHWEDTNVKTRVSTVLLTAIAVLAMLAGCSSDNSEHARVVAEVESVNLGAPLLVDDADAYEAVTVSFTARPYIEGLTTDGTSGAYSSFIVTAYDVTWEGTSASAPANIGDYNISRAGAHLQVPVYERAQFSVLVVDPAMKAAVMSTSFTANAHLTFYGHDSGNESEVAVHASLATVFTATAP